MGDEQDRLMELFNEARARSSPEERDAYLTAACGDDAALRRQVEALLKADTQAGNFLKPPCNDPPDCEGPGTVIGHYKLLQLIGEGGFGRVFMAEQLEPMRRKVAFKIIKLGMDTREVIARFEAERQALAMMDHPNIARVFDAGVTGCPLTPSLSPNGGEGVRRTGEGETVSATLSGGRPYFVMELVKGIPITDYCDQHQLSPADRLQLFLKVCHAVQHAHQKGVIHRDLKPSNILVTEQDGEAVPKIIDFGVAKAIGQPLTDKTLFTRFEQMIGTPTYMSPEQAGLGSLDVDTRTDIYALGVLLYELLTGTTPVQRETLHQAAVDEVRRLIREAEPPKPSTRLSALGNKLTEVAQRRSTEPAMLPKLVRGDLDWIVMKCLEKDRRRRYDTADALAQDLARHLHHEPVLASPPGKLYRADKFIRRHRVGVGMALAVSLTLIVGLIASLIGFTRATQQRRLARQDLYFAHIRLAYQDWEAGQISRMLEILRQHAPPKGEPDLRGWEWYYLFSLCHREERTLSGHTGAVRAVSVHPSGRWFASGGDDHTIRIWDSETGNPIAILEGHESSLRALAWSPDGGRLASADRKGKLILWNSVAFGRELELDCGGDLASVAWSPDGTHILVGATLAEARDRLVTMWDAATGECIRLFVCPGNVQQIFALAWQPGGRVVVGGGDWRGVMQVWEADTGQQLRTIKAHADVISALAWNPDGRRLASCGWDQQIKIWDSETWNELLEIDVAHHGAVESLAWSPDGQTLVSAGADGMVTVWDARTGARRNKLRGHQGCVQAVAWWGQRDLVLAGGDDGCLKVWAPDQDQAALTLAGQSCTFCWCPDGGKLASTGEPGDENAGFITIWDIPAWRIGYQLPYVCVASRGPVAMAWSPDDHKLAVSVAISDDQDSVRVWDLARREILRTFVVTNPVSEVRSLQWSPDGQRLLAACWRSGARIWSLQTNSPAVVFPDHRTSMSSAAWHPDGHRVASVDTGGRVLVWDAATGQVLRELQCPPGFNPSAGHQVVWNPRGDRLAAGAADGTIRVWEAATGRETHVLRGHTSNVRSLSWSPDGKRLVSAADDRMVRIWDPAIGRELLRLPSPANVYPSVAWSPCGRMLGTSDRSLRIFDATRGYELGAKLSHTQPSP